ncbi:MAG: glutaredoxin family protein [Terriglobales bacterium]
MPSLHQVVLYTRAGCHLCDQVKSTLARLEKCGGFTWKELDVDSDPELVRQFGEQVPVVFIDGKKAFKYRMAERDFLRRLQS